MHFLVINRSDLASVIKQTFANIGEKMSIQPPTSENEKTTPSTSWSTVATATGNPTWWQHWVGGIEGSHCLGHRVIGVANAHDLSKVNHGLVARVVGMVVQWKRFMEWDDL